MFIAVLVVLPSNFLFTLILRIFYPYYDKDFKEASMILLIVLFLFTLLPLIIFLVNYNKVFMKKTYIYLLVCFILCSILMCFMCFFHCRYYISRTKDTGPISQHSTFTDNDQQGPTQSMSLDQASTQMQQILDNSDFKKVI